MSLLTFLGRCSRRVGRWNSTEVRAAGWSAASGVGLSRSPAPPGGAKGGQGRERGRDQESPQVVRQERGAARDRSRRRGAPGRLPHRRLRLGQVDPPALCQPARAGRRGSRDHPRRGDHRTGRGREPDPPRDRNRLPGLQPLPAHERARQRHARPAQGARHCPAGGRDPGDRAARPLRALRQARRLPGSALGRTAATGGDRACARAAAPGDASRRGDECARPRARRGGPGRHPRARRGRNDDADRHARDELRPRHREQRLFPGRGCDPRAGSAGERSSATPPSLARASSSTALSPPEGSRIRAWSRTRSASISRSSRSTTMS